MSTIELVILGLVKERPMSAYDIQKNVAAQGLAQWAQVSVPSIYRKVVQLAERGYLHAEVVPGANSMRNKTLYALTESGTTYFQELMHETAAKTVPLAFEFNVMVSNLDKLPTEEALALLQTLAQSLQIARDSVVLQQRAQSDDVALPLRAILDEQLRLYDTLMTWLADFSEQFAQETGVNDM